MGKSAKASLYLLALAMLSEPGTAQVMETVSIADACSYFGDSVPDSVATFASDAEAVDVIKRIVDASGLIQNFRIHAAGVPNAAAVIDGDTRLILYNQRFMQNTKRSTGSEWGPVSIMAHEVGHHLNGHTLDNKGSRPKIELEADYYSGFILQRMGADLEEAVLAMSKLGSTIGSVTHPAKHDRLAAITNGWTKSCGADASCSGEPREPTDSEPPIEREGPNSCQYANDGECDEPDLCSAGTDTKDCKAPDAVPTPVPTRFPPGTQMSQCGCWGFNPPATAQEVRCQSGYVSLNFCPGFCPAGGRPYAYICQ